MEKANLARKVEALLKNQGERRLIEGGDGSEVKPERLVVSTSPSRLEKIREIVCNLDSSGDGVLQPSEVKVLFSNLLSFDMGEINDDHPEVMRFTGVSADELSSRLESSVSDEEVDQYYATLFPELVTGQKTSFTPPETNKNQEVVRDQIKSIVIAIDQDGDGMLDIGEVKILFSKLLELPIEEIADDHEDVVKFSGLTTDMMTEKLLSSVTKKEVEKCYGIICPIQAEDQRLKKKAIERECKAKIRDILEIVDSNRNGVMDPSEVKVLLSRMLGISVESIAHDNKDLLLFSGLSLDDMVESLYAQSTLELINAQHKTFSLESKASH